MVSKRVYTSCLGQVSMISGTQSKAKWSQACHWLPTASWALGEAGEATASAQSQQLEPQEWTARREMTAATAAVTARRRRCWSVWWWGTELWGKPACWWATPMMPSQRNMCPLCLTTMQVRKCGKPVAAYGVNDAGGDTPTSQGPGLCLMLVVGAGLDVVR